VGHGECCAARAPITTTKERYFLSPSFAQPWHFPCAHTLNSGFQVAVLLKVCVVRCPCIRVTREIHPLRLGFLCRRDTRLDNWKTVMDVNLFGTSLRFAGAVTNQYLVGSRCVQRIQGGCEEHYGKFIA